MEKSCFIMNILDVVDTAVCILFHTSSPKKWHKNVLKSVTEFATGKRIPFLHFLLFIDFHYLKKKKRKCIKNAIKNPGQG